MHITHGEILPLHYVPRRFSIINPLLNNLRGHKESYIELFSDRVKKVG